MTKKLFIILLSILTLSVAFSVCTVSAQDYNGSQSEIVMRVDSKEVSLFGRQMQNDVAPIITNGRTMLPARLVAEALGANVSWNETLQKVTVTRDDITIEMFVDSDIVYINGKKHQLDSKVFIKNSRTYTPVRFIAELLDAKVEWLGNTKQVVIDKNGYVSNQLSYHKPVAAPHNSYQNDIDIPMLNSETDNAKSFNRKIIDTITVDLKRGYGDEKFCKVTYKYLVTDGIVGILANYGTYPIGAGGFSPTYTGFFFDTKSDSQLTYEEYQLATGISHDSLAKTINLQNPYYNISGNDILLTISNKYITYAVCNITESEIGFSYRTIVEVLP